MGPTTVVLSANNVVDGITYSENRVFILHLELFRQTKKSYKHTCTHPITDIIRNIECLCECIYRVYNCIVATGDKSPQS